MKRLVFLLGLGTALTVSACSGGKGDGTGDNGDNAIDAVLLPRFEAENITPVIASKTEICRRLSADLLGRFATASEVSDDCDGRTVSEIARRFQSRQEYLVLSERRWRDRLRSNDVEQDWRYLKEVYGHVDDLHRGDMRYDDFVLLVSTHPGFMMGVFEPEEKAALAIRAFLGRTASEAEAADFASLYRAWIPSAQQDPDFAYAYRIEALILPGLCEPLTSCTSDLLGGGVLDMSSFPSGSLFEGVLYEDLSAVQLSAIQEPGRVLIRQPALYEAAADEILNRLLAWSDGGRFPREPGIVLPEVREVLADYLRESGDYAAAERMVINSLLYRQAAEIEPDGFGEDPLAPVPPIYQHGPVKPVIAETWLDSTAALTFELGGTCDPRYTDGFPYFLLMEGAGENGIPQAQLGEDVARLYEMMEDRRAWDETGADGYYPFPVPDFTYDYVAGLIGGCPGFDGEREAQTGLSYAFTQETLAELLCAADPLALGDDTEVADILRFQMRQTLGRNPTNTEIADFEAAADTCAGAECSPEGMRNQVCVGLLGSMPMIFY